MAKHKALKKQRKKNFIDPNVGKIYIIAASKKVKNYSAGRSKIVVKILNGRAMHLH